MMGVVVVYYSFDFHSGVSEVEDQAEIEAGWLQIVQALGQEPDQLGDN
jgi:hypothetical protein